MGDPGFWEKYSSDPANADRIKQLANSRRAQEEAFATQNDNTVQEQMSARRAQEEAYDAWREANPTNSEATFEQMMEQSNQKAVDAIKARQEQGKDRDAIVDELLAQDAGDPVDLRDPLNYSDLWMLALGNKPQNDSDFTPRRAAIMAICACQYRDAGGFHTNAGEIIGTDYCVGLMYETALRNAKIFDEIRHNNPGSIGETYQRMSQLYLDRSMLYKQLTNSTVAQ